MFGIWIVIIIAVAYIIFVGFLFIFQSRYVYYPEPVLSANPGNIGLYFESVSFVTTDGVKLSGWFVPHENARGVILFCHGNAGNISHRLESIQIFHQLGLDVFIFDYRGYGQSEGKPTEQGTYKDVEAAWRYLIEERQVQSKKVIVFGRSLGGAIAAWVTQSHTPGALILESTFISVRDIATRLYPYLPVKLLLRYKYNTAEYLGKVDCPVLIVHSRDDEIMPFSLGQQLFKMTKGPKQFLEITGTHNVGFITSGEHYEEGLNTFISEYIGPKI
jgi:alpha-beta hydrolase superfamily lysophospholipase